MARLVGIDLGTTNSCVAYLEGESPVVIPNLDGLPTTPSVVSFTSTGERLVGTPALRQSIANPRHTIAAVKRLIGQKFASPQVSEAARRLPYTLAEAGNGDVLISVGDELITPQEVSSHILGYLKSCAESFFGEPVEEAVVTVPAHFNDHQRQATKDAAKIAGLSVLRVVNEPTAASLAYGLLKADPGAKVAVYDLGGGTFDVTLLEIADGVFQVLSTSGDSYLGGEDFDARIAEWLMEDFRRETGVDLHEDKLALQRVREAAEKAKKELSFTAETEINLPFITSEGPAAGHIRRTLTRSRLEELTGDLVRRSLPLVERALADARLTPADIREVILVGGQTRMPLVKKEIAGFFGRPPAEHVNPDEIVAMGAALQAGIIRGGVRDLVVLLDVTPLSLGIQTEGDVFQKIIDRNTPIPVRRAMPFTTVENNQRRVKIHVLQGEEMQASRNKSLATFELIGIQPALAGIPQIDVTFEIDADGLVRVSACDTSTGREQGIEVRPSSGLLPAEVRTLADRRSAGALKP